MTTQQRRVACDVAKGFAASIAVGTHCRIDTSLQASPNAVKQQLSFHSKLNPVQTDWVYK